MADGFSVDFIHYCIYVNGYFQKNLWKIFVVTRIFSDVDTLLNIITTFGIIGNSSRMFLGRLPGLMEKRMDFETG